MELQEARKRVEESGKDIPKGFVLNILDGITPDKALVEVEELKVGDVFFYKVAGGKLRPWVVLKKKKGVVGCCTLTHHKSLFGAIPSQCRYYKDSVLGPTLTIFEESSLDKMVTIPYSNKRHLMEVRKTIREFWS